MCAKHCAARIPPVTLNIKSALLHIYALMKLEPFTLLVNQGRSNRSVAMGWHGMANAIPGQQDASFLPILGNFLQSLVFALSL